MKLWVVMHGEYGESQSPRSIHLRLDTAIAEACKVAGRNHRVETVPDDFAQTTMHPERWEVHRGCDITAVEAFEVLP